MHYGTDAGTSKGDEQELVDEYLIKQGFLRQNWCWVVRIVLAIIGITIPIIMFMKPCEDEEVMTYEIQKAPLDLFLLLDGSGSMKYDWGTCLSAATSIISVFAGSNISEFRVAAGQFSTTANTIVDYTNDTDYATSVIQSESLQYGYTYYEWGLQLFLDMWSVQKNPDANLQSILVMISDGAPTYNYDANVRYDELAENIRNVYNVSIMGIMVANGGNGRAQAALKSVSSCDDFSYNELGNCTWYAEFDDFETFLSHSKGIANSLTETVLPIGVERYETICVKTPWLGFLLLLLPLLAVLIMPYCVSLKRHVKLIRPKPKPKQFEKIDTSPQDAGEKLSSLRPPPPPPAALQPQTSNGESKYKWKIKAADHYIWGGAGGSRPLRVDWAGSAPPSAPKDLRDEDNMEKVPLQPPVVSNAKAIQVTDLGNGYVEEELILEQTLEQWTEAKAKAFWLKVKSCCCCFCYK